MPIHGYPGGVITANPVAPTSSVATGVWTTEQQLQAVSQGNWPGYEYPIANSLRFNSADSAYLNRTPASASNRKTWTWSGWVKRGALGTAGVFEALSSASNETSFAFNSTNTLFLQDYAGASYNLLWETPAVFRDVSAWYHLVLVYDTTQASSANAVKLYVNGVQQTLTFTAITGAYVQNRDGFVNNTISHTIGRYAAANYLNSYMTEVNFIDGQALDPSSFGLNDPETGVWSPKRYTGTYGTNGFYLNFSDNSGTTSTTLGKDYSGNGNNWTPNNFSVTAGVGNDSMVDSPTSYGTDSGLGAEVRGNYATLNPLNKNSAITLANGNLDFSASNNRFVTSTIAVSSGKWYWEFVPANGGTGTSGIGVIRASDNVFGTDAFASAGSYVGVGYLNNGQKSISGTRTSYGATYTTNNVIGVALDLDSGTQTITFYKNNSSQGSINLPSAGQTWIVATDYSESGTHVTNFGQRAFAYTAPSGFKALCTQNLPTPTIGATSTTQANDYMNVVLWTGNSSTQTVTGVGFQPDLVWAKKRSGAERHVWFDAVRGAGYQLSSDLTAAETYLSNTLTSFTSDGFSNGNNGYTNESPFTYVAWNWKANGAGSSNTAGTITSTVSANTTSGFSIVSFTSTGSQGTVGHGLGIAPSMIIMKQRSGTGAWSVYHVSIGNTKRLVLNTTDAEAVDSIWGNTTPTSTVFTQNVSASTPTAIAYCFAPVAGYSAFGSYTGDGSTDGPFVYTNHRPRYLLIKNYTNSGNGWIIIDTARSTYNTNALQIYANSSAAESSSTAYVDILSNGFKLKSGNSDINNTGVSYIYAAFAESPFKYSLAR